MTCPAQPFSIYKMKAIYKNWYAVVKEKVVLFGSTKIINKIDTIQTNELRMTDVKGICT